jgi:hypothetical protein
VGHRFRGATLAIALLFVAKRNHGIDARRAPTGT